MVSEISVSISFIFYFLWGSVLLRMLGSNSFLCSLSLSFSEAWMDSRSSMLLLTF